MGKRNFARVAPVPGWLCRAELTSLAGERKSSEAGLAFPGCAGHCWMNPFLPVAPRELRWISMTGVVRRKSKRR